MQFISSTWNVELHLANWLNIKNSEVDIFDNDDDGGNCNRDNNNIIIY